MRKILCLLMIMFFPSLSWAVMDEEISHIRYQMTAIEHEYTLEQKQEKIQALDTVIEQAEKIIAEHPDRAEGHVWKGLALSAQAKHKGKGLGALSAAKKARATLEQAIEIDPQASDAAAFNTLAMLYYKVPGWPIGFGNKDKAREYFRQALDTSSNLDTNYRYGEFLLSEGQRELGVEYLQKALSFPDRPGRAEDVLKKQDVRQLLGVYK